MKWSIILGCAAVVLLGIQPTARGDKPSSGKPLHFKMRVFEGDPLGSRAAGTLKILAEPSLVTRENRPFSFVSGGEIAVPSDGGNEVTFVPFGQRIVGTPGTITDGKLRLDITISNTTVKTGNEDRTELSTESTRTITTVRLGEVVKLHWRKGDTDKQRWVELTAEEVEP